MYFGLQDFYEMQDALYFLNINEVLSYKNLVVRVEKIMNALAFKVQTLGGSHLV